MEVVNTYIVNYSNSFAENELAILFECKHNVYYIKYDGFEHEEIKQIHKSVAISLIKPLT